MVNYSEKFDKEINKVINQFNAKVRKLQKQGNKYLPKEIDVTEFKSTYQYSQSALKSKLADLERFSERGAERIIELKGGAKITAWEHESLQRETRSLKTYLSKEIKTYGSTKPTIRGVTQYATYAQMGDSTYENMKQIRQSLNRTTFDQRQLNRYKGKVETLSKRRLTGDYVFKQSYQEFIRDLTDKVKNNIDDAAFEYVKELSDSVLNKLENMDAHKFYDIYRKEKIMQDIRDKYNVMKVIMGDFSDNDIDDVVGDLEYINQIL